MPQCSWQVWVQTPSPSHDRLASQQSWPLYVELGKLSRLYGNLIESATSEHDLSVVLSEMQLLERLSTKVHEGWKAVRWSEVYDPAALGEPMLHCCFHQIPGRINLGYTARPTRSSDTTPWSALKTLLFSFTMLHASLISLLTSKPVPSTSSRPAPIAQELASCSLRTFAPLQFVSAQFGGDGSGLAPYKAVWHGAIDLVVQAGSSRAVGLAYALEPRSPVGERVTGRVEVGSVAYYLDVVEHLAGVLSDAYVEARVLPRLAP
jgi:hypothetical protein